MQLPFNKVVILCNPASTHADAAKKRIRELRRLVAGEHFLLLETSDRGREANIKLLFKYINMLGSDTLLAIAAGDGTINMVVEALACCGSEEARQTIILPLWGGNANDIAHMLNGPSYRISIRNLIEKGRVVTIRPLRCALVRHDGDSVTRLAVGYISFGATALAARRLNEPLHRSSRLHKIPGGRAVQELLTVLQALLKAPSFRIEDDKGERFIYDRMFINGSRIGKVRPLPFRLTDDTYYETTVIDKRFGAAVARFREMLRRPAIQKAPQVARFTCLDKAWAQFDGETMRLAPGTRVEVSRAPVALRAWSVRLYPSLHDQEKD
jgi:diacylglycerol kinase family enzyme